MQGVSDKKMIAALDSVIWYNGLAETVFSWRELQPENPKYSLISCPIRWFEADTWWGAQLQVIWMIAVDLFGDCGTSPRFGWIEKTEEFRQWLLDITEIWRSSDEYTGDIEFYIAEGMWDKDGREMTKEEQYRYTKGWKLRNPEGKEIDEAAE